MKTSSITKNSKLFFFIIWLVFLTSFKCHLIYAQPLRVFAVSDLDRIYEDGYKLPPVNDAIKIFGIRGEVLSGQCAVFAEENLTNVTVEINELKNAVTGDVIAPSSVEWNFVGSIPLPSNTPNQPAHVVERAAPAKYPDYLMAEKQIDISKGIYRSVWLTISIPENLNSGKFLANVTVKASQGEQSIPLEIEVFSLTLPSERHLKVTEWFNTNFSRFHEIEEQYSDEWFGMLEKYVENMRSHRQNIFRVPMNTVEIKKSINGELQFDFAQFDQICEAILDKGEMEYIETGFLTNRGEERWYSTEIFFNDFNVIDEKSGGQITIPGKEVIPELLPAFEGHLREKGWLDQTYFHIMDEPSHHNALSWMEISAYMNQLAPDLVRMDAIETYLITDELEVAVPKLDHFVSWYDEWKKAQQKGVELWFYTVGTIQSSLLLNKTIDMPVIQSRTMHWLNYKYDATGYLHWGWNQWTEDPYNEVGRHLGDGWHVYPVKDGVLNSLRWEQMRNGIQDYEYFWMLEDRVASLKDSLGSYFNWINPKQRSKEIASMVIKDLAEYSNDPQVLYDAKKQIIEELINFDKSPLIYVQTNPIEHSAVTNQTRIGVCGWVEPGTKVEINRSEVPVDIRGLFQKVFVVTTRSNTISIKATNNKGTKEIVRHFTIKN